MVNTQLLDNAIKDSGLKISYISDTLGISRQSFNNKRKNKTDFRTAEVYVLCDLLNLKENERTDIFDAK